LAPGGGDGDGDALADDGVEVDTLVATEEPRFEVEEGRHPLGPRERREQQRVGAEGGRDPEPPIRLREAICAVAFEVHCGACAAGFPVGVALRVVRRRLVGTAAPRSTASASCRYLRGSGPLPRISASVGASGLLAL